MIIILHTWNHSIFDTVDMMQPDLFLRYNHFANHVYQTQNKHNNLGILEILINYQHIYNELESNLTFSNTTSLYTILSSIFKQLH